jgi:hypothetical protein
LPGFTPAASASLITVSVALVRSHQSALARSTSSSLPGGAWLALTAASSALLDWAVNRLPSEQREALLMIVIDEDSYESVAERTGCVIGTLKSRVHRARHIRHCDAVIRVHPTIVDAAAAPGCWNIAARRIPES